MNPVEKTLDFIKSQIEDCNKNENYQSLLDYGAIAKLVSENKHNCLLSLIEAPKIKNLEEQVNFTVTLEQMTNSMKKAYENDDEDIKPSLSSKQKNVNTERKTIKYSISSHDVKTFIIQYLLRCPDYTCQANLIAEEFRKKYDKSFIETDRQIKKTGGKQTPAWKNRFYSLGSSLKSIKKITGVRTWTLTQPELYSKDENF